MNVDRPIFIVAPPRCGTSLLYDCLASHPDVGHFNRANRKFPDSPRLAWWLTKLGVVRDSSRESRAIWFRFLGAREVNVRATVLERFFQGFDHPVLAAFPEGLYLKSVLALVEPL